MEIGDHIPAIKLKDQNGENFDLKKFVGQKALVVYFYPKDFTPGCTKEACNFRDSYEDFKELGAEVIGVSLMGLNGFYIQKKQMSGEKELK